MLSHPTHDRLIALGLTGMAKALEEQRRQPDVATLAFEERIAMMIDREAVERENKRLTTRLKFACLRQSAVVEDVDMKAPRGLDKALFHKLVGGDWIDRHQNLIVIGPTGVGKSWLACALGHKACRDDRSVSYQRVPRSFDALALARGDGRHARLLKSLARVELLILDDCWQQCRIPGIRQGLSAPIHLPMLQSSVWSTLQASGGAFFRGVAFVARGWNTGQSTSNLSTA
jgi:DNA replication protein DnaC